ncbi:pilus (MSHA type) biogenesis protein MshL [Glaciecola sp. 1036]|uniref:pilus (MSHA type) biogenesis protein MshL n=1 Tax=Alteromonadaceae TaxID=72275 RepID=UPI003D06F58C
MIKLCPKITISLLALTSVLSSCSSTKDSHVEQSLAHDIQTYAASQPSPAPLSELPPTVADTLLGAEMGQQTLIETEKYDISAKGVEAAAFFAGLVQDTPYSVAVHPDVTGNISLDLKQVSLDTVFKLITDIYGYHVEKIDAIYRVFPAGLRTETFSVNYLMMKRDGQTQTSIISGGISQGGNNSSGNGGFGQQNNFSGNSQSGSNLSGGGLANANNGTTISTRNETDFWKNLEESLKTMIGNEDGKSVLVSPQAGLVTVRANPEDINIIRRFLKISEQSLTRQVVIEARILEVELNDEYQQGINWTQIVSNIGSTDITFASTPGNFGNALSATLGGLTSVAFQNKDFIGVIDLLETQGNVQVLSSPRVTALNNQKAVIKVGDDEYFVTDISSQNTITSTTTSVVPDIELTPFFSGIALDVTPQIDEHGRILLHVHPSVIETEEQEKIVTLNQEQIVLPLAQSTIRESDTMVSAQSGEIVVIGGLMQSVKSREESKTPVLGNIPVLGNLFKSVRDKESKKELIILLKPTVVTTNTWRNQLEQSRSQMADWLYVE